MKTLFVIIFIGFFTNTFAQDTIELVTYNDGAKSFKRITSKDTSQVYLYPGGKRESVCQLVNWEPSGTYTRWYENGKMMWQKELSNAVSNGKSVFYDKNGVKIAELIFTNGKITDTIFIRENTHFILGKVTYTSTVYGGAVRKDGSSNVSERSGAFANFSMYAASVDSIKKPVLVSKFKSDFNGDFCIVVPTGKIGFFPQSINIASLEAGQFTIPEFMQRSGSSSWTKQGPFEVTKTDRILLIELHNTSVGYAP